MLRLMQRRIYRKEQGSRAIPPPQPRIFCNHLQAAMTVLASHPQNLEYHT